MKKNIDFSNELLKAIQEYADLYCRGNFTVAVNQLSRKGLSVKV
jgi:hypothetical protein